MLASGSTEPIHLSSLVSTRAQGETPDEGHRREAVHAAFNVGDGTERWVFAAEEGLTAPTVGDGRTYVDTTGAVRAFR